MWGQRSVPCSTSPVREQRSQTLKPAGWDGSPRPVGSSSAALRTRSWSLPQVGQVGLPTNSHQGRLWTPECGTFTELTTSDLFVLISLGFTSTRPGSHTHQSQTPSAERSTQEVHHASDSRDVNCKTPLPDPSFQHLPSACAQQVACRAGWAAQRLVVTAGGQGQAMPAGIARLLR